MFQNSFSKCIPWAIAYWRKRRASLLDYRLTHCKLIRQGLYKNRLLLLARCPWKWRSQASNADTYNHYWLITSGCSASRTDTGYAFLVQEAPTLSNALPSIHLKDYLRLDSLHGTNCSHLQALLVGRNPRSLYLKVELEGWSSLSSDRGGHQVVFLFTIQRLWHRDIGIWLWRKGRVAIDSRHTAYTIYTGVCKGSNVLC